MTIDITALRAKLNELSSKSRISDVLWKPQEGMQTVRIVPLASNPEIPFIEAYFHYLGGKTHLSPLTYGEADPIEEFCQKLRGDSGTLSKEEYAETKKFMPKMRTFAPIVIRGKEAEGVRFWGFGKTTYTELLGVISDPEYGDICDAMNGRDIKVEFTPKEKSDTKFPKTAIRISPKQTPITTDKELLNKILTVQPNIFDVYPRLSYVELKLILERFLTPSAKTEVTVTATDDWGEPVAKNAEAPSPTAAASKKASSKPAVVDKIDEDFDALFK